VAGRKTTEDELKALKRENAELRQLLERQAALMNTNLEISSENPAPMPKDERADRSASPWPWLETLFRRCACGFV